MKTRPPAACPFFASNFQAQLLGMLFDDPAGWHTAGALQEEFGVSAATLHDELTRLTAARVLERDDRRRPFRYRPDMASPFAEALQTLTGRSVGVSRRLRRLLNDQRGVAAAAIFGSWARGEANGDSDIDLMVVGDIDFTALVRALRPLEREISREINVVAYSPAEIAKRRRSSFLREVRRSPVEDLVGDLHATLAAA